jgi:hypothetical protein
MVERLRRTGFSTHRSRSREDKEHERLGTRFERAVNAPVSGIDTAPVRHEAGPRLDDSGADWFVRQRSTVRHSAVHRRRIVPLDKRAKVSEAAVEAASTLDRRYANSQSVGAPLRKTPSMSFSKASIELLRPAV